MITVLIDLVTAFPIPAGADPQEADRCVKAARQVRDLPGSGQAEAAVLFQRAIDLDPARRMEWQRELADALSFSERSPQAVPLYQEVLKSGKLSVEETRWAHLGLARALEWSHHLHASLRECDALVVKYPNNVEAHLRRAEVLLYLDRKRTAKREYETVLRLDPKNQEAPRFLGLIQSWQGRQQDALRILTAYLHDHPDNTEGIRFLAQAQDWMGRPDLAMQTLEESLARHPDDDWTKKLLDRIRLDEQPTTSVDYQASTQTDHLDISVVSLQQNTQVENGRATLGARYQWYDYSPPAGQIPITVNRPGIAARRRLSDRSEVNGNLNLDLIAPERRAKDRQVLTYDLYYTLWPSDRFRFDFGSRRTTFDNITSLTKGISATYGSYSVDFMPAGGTKLTVRGNWGTYTDGNRSFTTQVEAAREVWPNPHLWLGARYTDFTFAETVDNGYYDPSSYRSGVLTMHLWGRRGERFYYDLDGSYGREDANPGGGKPFSSLGGKLSYQIQQRMLVEARWQFFSSRQATGSGSTLSSSGFARHTIGIFLRLIM
jgi:tetratricopeptide (TPR) repeat protein